MISLLVGIVSIGQARSEPPALLLSVAAEFRKTGAEVQVSNVENRDWEIWVDYTGPNPEPLTTKLRHIKKLTALRIFSDSLTDKNVAKIRNLRDLNLLVLMSKKLTDAALIPIVQFSNLNKLDLNKASLTKIGLEKLRDLKHLRRLFLYNAKIPDADLAVLKQLTGLDTLYLPTGCGEKMFRELQQSMQETEVILNRAKR